MMDRTECEAYDDEPMSDWAERLTALIRETDPPPPTQTSPAGSRKSAAAEPFTRTRPLPAPLVRNVRLTPPTSGKEVRQFGFDISEHVREHGISYAAGDSFGVYTVNSDYAVDTWLSATGLTGTEMVVVDGAEVSLQQALTSSYDVCRVTPNLLKFVAEHCGDKVAAEDAAGTPR